MGRRQQQHMGRSAGDDRELVGRDAQEGDETAERASPAGLPMPNEEGSGPAGGSHDFGTGSRGNAASDEETQRRGGSGSRE